MSAKAKVGAVGAVAVALVGAAASCVDHQPSPLAGKVSSLALTLVDPPADQLGSPMAPVQAKQATFNVAAFDDRNQPYTGDLDVEVYISFGGVKTGTTTSCGADDSGTPITTLHLAGGQASNQTVQLPNAFGASIIWLDEPKSHATGASPTIYFRNPYVADVQTPPDLTAVNATFCSPFNGKFVIIDQPSNNGQLVVTSVFGDAFAVTDTGGTTFNSIYIYSFGKPPNYIIEGKVLNSFSGNVSKFVGFTELNFPLFDPAPESVPLAPLPSPQPLDQATLVARDNITLLGYDAGLVVFTGTICDPFPPNPNHDPNIQRTDDSWTKFNQFVLDGDGTCSSLSNYGVELPGKTLGTFDPLMVKGHMATIQGMLRNNSGQNPITDANGQPVSCDDNNPCVTGTCDQGICKKGAFNFWTIVPRHPSDVTVQ